jgi:hypothetical protein
MSSPRFGPIFPIDKPSQPFPLDRIFICPLVTYPKDVVFPNRAPVKGLVVNTAILSCLFLELAYKAVARYE